MSIIAHLHASESGYEGVFETLTCAPAPLRFEPNADKVHDRMPDFRIYRGASEIGGAWIKRAAAGRAYLSVILDDPAFAAPIECRLVEGQEGFRLVWSR